ncbi:hypothetical protein, partial [uncultured Nostoc sp.]|uniref:hypothetical protein n=1 Tax=uncultured Nostoc sp. TaxID=340711 RepID=UPI0035CBC7C3
EPRNSNCEPRNSNCEPRNNKCDRQIYKCVDVARTSLRDAARSLLPRKGTTSYFDSALRLRSGQAQYKSVTTAA